MVIFIQGIGNSLISYADYSIKQKIMFSKYNSDILKYLKLTTLPAMREADHLHILENFLTIRK